MANVFSDFADPEKDVVSSNPFEEFGGPEARKPGNPFSEFQGPDNEELTAPFAEFPDQNQEVIKSSLRDTLPPLLMNEAVTMRKAQDIGASVATSAVKGTGEALSGAAAVAGFFAKEQIKAAEKWQPEALPDKEKLLQVKPEELVPYQAGQKIFNWAKAQDESRPKLIGPTTKQMADTVGSTIPYLAATAVNPWLGVVAGVGGDAKEFYDDAKLKGASQEDADFAMMLGGLVGTTEMAPIELALTPLNKLPGGRAIKKGLLRFFRRNPNVYKAAQAGSEAAFTAAGEAIQEDLVQLTKNLTASDFVGYDPDRPWQENLAETTGYSAGAGAIVSAIAQMLRIKGVVPPATVGVIGPRDVTSDGVLPTPEDMENMTTRALTALKDVDPTGDYNKKTVLRSMTKGGAGKAELDTVKAMFADPRLTDDKGKMKGRVLLDGLKEAMYPLTEQVQGAGNEGLRATYGLGLWDPTVNPASIRRGEIPEFIPLWALPKLRELSNSMRGMSEEELRNPNLEMMNEYLQQEVVEEPNRLENLARGDHKSLQSVLRQAGIGAEQLTSLGALRELIDTVLDKNDMLAAGSWTFNAPFPTYMNRVKHYGGHERFITPNYVGHIRAFFHPKTPGTFFVAETQSDRTHHLQDIERVRNDLETSRDQAELDQITSQLAPLQEALTALENAGLTDAVQAVRKAENALDDRFASVPEAIDAVQNTMHDLLRKEKELFDAIDEKTRFLAKNQKLNELGEQPMLNRMAQRAAVIAHRQGATHVAFPLPETVGALQMWRIETPQGERWIPQLTATELNEIGEKKIRIADSQGRRIYPSNKLNKVKKLLSFLKEQYGEYQIIEDPMGYKWAQFELTPDIVNSMEMLWGFPGPLGQAASRSFVDLIDRITGTAGHAGLLTRLGLNQPVRRDHMESDKDAFNKIMKLTYGLTNIARENPHITGLAKYVEEVRQFWNTKTFWQAKADGTLKEIQKLSGEMQDKVFRFALKVTVMSDRLHRRLNAEELERLNNDPAFQLDDQALEAFERIDQDMRDALEQLYEVLVAERRRAFQNNPVAAQEAIRKLNENFDKLRNRHFFPLTRFGDHYVMTKTTQDRTIDGVQYKAGDVIELRTFEGVGAVVRQKAYYNLHKQFEDQRHVSVSAGKFAEAVRATIGLPPQAVEMLERTVELTAEQKDLLAELVTQLSPATSFMKHLLERQATPGFSMDGMRGYAEYFSKFSNYIARETHKSALNDYLNDVGKSAVEIRNEGGDSTKRDHIYTWMQEHLKYLFDPGNEAANWRAGAFIWYLGFVPKSAYINLTQPILVTYPYLAAKYGHIGSGDIKAALGLSQAYMDTAGSGIAAVLSRVFRDVSQDVVTANRIEPWLQEMIAKGVQENFLDESFATELAAISEGSLISRSTGYKTGRYVRTVGRWASYLFQQAERVNRRVAFIAAARLAFISIARGRAWADLSGVERNLIYKEARDAIEATQYEYARWNRPEMMRGPVKATLFTFFQYLTNTLFFATRMPGRGRFLLMLMLTAGLMGLPGADDLTKFLDALFTRFPQLRKFFGLSEKPMTDLQLEMRQYFAELTDRDTADLIMHGFGREYGLGPIHLLSLAGLPVPHTDVSGSIGMGRIVPGVPSFVKALSVNQDFSSAFTAFAQDAVGASFAVPLMILEALANPGPDVFKTVERTAPKALSNVSKAAGALSTGEYRTRFGTLVGEFDLEDPVQVAEAVAMGAGFRPTRLARESEMSWSQAEHMSFYEGRRKILLRDYVYYRDTQPDPVELKKVNQAIDQFNSNAPSLLKIRGDQKKDARIRRRKKDVRTGQGLPTQRRFRSVYKEVRDAFPSDNLED